MARRSTIGENPLDSLIPAAPPKASGRTKPEGPSPAPSTGAEASPPPPPAAEAADPGRPALRDRVTLHLPAWLVDRMRNAVYWTPGMTMADLAEAALRKELERLEEERGEAFPTRQSELKRGRPVR